MDTRTPQQINSAASPISERRWAILMLLPFALLLILIILYPFLYGLWLGRNPASYKALLDNPVYPGTLRNTFLFLFVAVNIKMLLALALSALFVSRRTPVRWLSIALVLPWAIPTVPAVLSFRWMFNSEWGLFNNLLLRIGINGPQWLIRPDWALLAICITHIWKYLPFWVISMTAGRMGIAPELYDAARLDGATPLQTFRHVTWPGLRNLYLINTLIATIWALGDFNTIHLLTGGGPMDRTHTLATLGFRYAFVLSDLETGVATVVTAIPLLLPLLWLLARKMARGTAP